MCIVVKVRLKKNNDPKMSVDQTKSFCDNKDLLNCDVHTYVEARTRSQMRLHRKRHSEYRDRGVSPKRFKGRMTRMDDLKKRIQDKTNKLSESERDTLYNKWQFLAAHGTASDNPVEDEKNIKAFIEHVQKRAMEKVRTLWIMPGADSTNEHWKWLEPHDYWDVDEEWDKHGPDEESYSWRKFCAIPKVKRCMKQGDVRICADGEVQRLRWHYETHRIDKRWDRFTEYYTPWGSIKWDNTCKTHVISYLHPDSKEPQTLEERPYFECDAEEILKNKCDELRTERKILPWNRCKHEISFFLTRNKC